MPRPTKEQKVYEEFRDAEEALTTGQVSDRSGVTRATARKWIKKLVEKGKLQEVRKVGNIKLYEQAPPQEHKEQRELTHGTYQKN